MAWYQYPTVATVAIWVLDQADILSFRKTPKASKIREENQSEYEKVCQLAKANDRTCWRQLYRSLNVYIEK